MPNTDQDSRGNETKHSKFLITKVYSLPILKSQRIMNKLQQLSADKCCSGICVLYSAVSLSFGFQHFVSILNNINEAFFMFSYAILDYLL